MLTVNDVADNKRPELYDQNDRGRRSNDNLTTSKKEQQRIKQPKPEEANQKVKATGTLKSDKSQGEKSVRNAEKRNDTEKPLVKVFVQRNISKTQAELIAEIPSQIEKPVQFSFDIQKDTPENTADDMVKFFKLAQSLVKPIAS